MERRITVAVRIRPSLETERFGPLCAYRADDGQTVIIKNEGGGMDAPAAFRFDDVFDGRDSQRDVYEESVQELVDAALEGANMTVLAYGQTGSGKTCTILGSMSDGNLTEESGIFPRVFNDIFAYRESVQRQKHLIVFLSAIELYMDDVMDLISRRRKMNLCETPEGTLIPGVSIIELLTMTDVLQTLNMVNAYRSVTSAKMNDFSSRSHALFFIDIFQVPLSTSPERPTREKLIDVNGIPIRGSIEGLVGSRITLVDLAGSERVKRSGVEDQAMVETQEINKSLSVLGTVINGLYMGSNHIPFQESKLTRLLKHSLVDGVSCLLLIGQITPPSASTQESQGTLRFCDRVKGLKVGRVTAFIDSAEEERYLRSLRQQEELTAELRIAAVEYYYRPMRSLFMAPLKNISVEQARRKCIALLRKDAANIVVRKEEECLRVMEAEINLKQREQVQAFVEKMNQMIEEYESVAQIVKKNKKEAKRQKEEQKMEEEEKLMEAKKAKKSRLKQQAKVEELTVALQEADRLVSELETGCATPLEEDAKEHAEALTAEKPEDNSVHLLMENFYSHATELGHLHDLYAHWLGATQRQRSHVRRAKIFSSPIIMGGTLVYDIIDFIIDRAVDIANRAIDQRQKYSWSDIDGYSCALRNWEQLYPPLMTAAASRFETCEPTAYHNITFLSSDDSDGENSHHREEICMRRAEAELVDRELRATSEELRPPVQRLDNALGGATAQAKMPQADGTEIHGRISKGSGMFFSAAEAAAADVHANDTDSEYYDKERNGEGTGGANHSLNTEENAEGEAAHNASPKGQRRSTRDNEYLMRVYDSPTLVQDLIRFLRCGTMMLKHGRSGKPHRRYFWVSIAQNSRKLVWSELEEKTTTACSSINLSDVSFIQLGCFSKVFKRHYIPPTDPSFYRSFTVGLKAGGRTVDIVADSLPDFEAWIVGLSNLVRVDPVWGGKLDITKETQFDQLNCFEAGLCESNYIYPSQYIALKKRVKRIASMTLTALDKCGNDATRAQKLLGGIHLPSVNEKGAVYLTKGELRFIGQSEMDILRITKVWILFQQMNLVYDDNFVPATTFGVTERH
ncbi:putative kinesin [Trypanosoma rangeli]|uniref:Putative kinesin n=1 Tax=Trypanosoma rangeli TaxID=5698 RepID=A0A422N790_TRYRA|nr:putative kinesin [Trypanosoma rangeli]RNF01354.1 putative kinesin [Trypanosoma rangeli]|eukprot:RNF01354.1 putative kinesin [Trypanosoma rangeli]